MTNRGLGNIWCLWFVVVVFLCVVYLFFGGNVWCVWVCWLFGFMTFCWFFVCGFFCFCVFSSKHGVLLGVLCENLQNVGERRSIHYCLSFVSILRCVCVLFVCFVFVFFLVFFYVCFNRL